ncbi:MAG: radical SAM protein [Desulfovibrionales bacterium]|nr:radical SAM protein [Desulfovibrionales bacterium]
MHPTSDPPVLLINSNRTSPVSSSDTIPISLGYIGAFLRDNGFEIVLWDDLKDRPLSLLKIREFILDRRPLYVAFSAYMENMENIRLLAKFIKELDPRIPIVIGGPQATFMPTEALLDLRHMDVISRGDGEIVARDLACSLQKGLPLSFVRGISYKVENRLYDNPMAEETGDDLDTYPSPYLTNVLDLSHKDTAILLTSRGCVYPCVFCYTPRAFHHKVKIHSIERVLEEIRHCVKRGIRQFWFADPNFSFSRERLECLLDKIIEQGLDIRFWCQTRYDLVDASLLMKLKRAGAATIAYGMESGSPRVLDTIRKKLDLDRLSKAIKLAQSFGVNVELFTLYGLPGETFADAYETVRFVKNHGVRIEGNSCSQQLQVYFGTEIQRDYRKFGIIPQPQYKPRYLSIGDDFETENLTSKEIKRLKALWFINNAFFQEKVEAKTDIFPLLSYLVHQAHYLDEEPEFYLYLTKLLCEVEEFELLYRYLSTARAAGQSWLKEWIRRVPFYRDSSSAAGSGMKVILDIAGYLGERPIPSTSGRFWPLVIGEGRFLPEFESKMAGLKAGEERRFQVRFPHEYPDRELAGQDATFMIRVHKVMEPVFVQGIEDIPSLGICNTYQPDDLDSLRKTQEALYYIWLRSLNPEELMQSPQRGLDLISKYLCLGRFTEAMTVAEKIFTMDGLGPKVIRVLMDGGLFEFALELINKTGRQDHEGLIQQIRCYLSLKDYDRALEILKKIYNERDLRVLYCLLDIYQKKGEAMEVVEELKEKFLDGQIRYSLLREEQRIKMASPVCVPA